MPHGKIPEEGLSPAGQKGEQTAQVGSRTCVLSDSHAKQGVENTGRRALHGQTAVGVGVRAAMSSRAFVPSPPRKGKRSWTVGHWLSLPYSPLGRRKRKLQDALLFQKHSPSPSLTVWGTVIPASPLNYCQTTCKPELEAGAARQGQLPSRQVPALLLSQGCSTASPLIQLCALVQPGDARPTRSTKGPASRMALQKLLLHL